MEIKVLARRGVGIREIAKQLGCSRNTVRRYLRDEEAQRYGPRSARATKLDAYRDVLRERVKAAHPHWIPAVVLHREIQELGYEGGITQLKQFINGLRDVKADPVVRFETPPGKQMQADFTHIRRGRDPLIAFVATLGYSRMSWVRFTTDERADTLCSCIGDALFYFGGVPQHVLFDNASTIIVERDAYGEGQHRWHSKLLSVAEEFGFSPRVCAPYRPVTKGKVERFNGYLKGSFCVPLAATLKQSGLRFDAQTANAYVGRWLDEIANARIHGTTHERPDHRMLSERPMLLSLPERIGHDLMPPPVTERPVPLESLQHPLSVYNELLEIHA